MRRILFIFLMLTTTLISAQTRPEKTVAVHDANRPLHNESQTLQSAGGSKPSFVYDVDFELRFDNREFSQSAFTPSMTIFGARLTPSVGLAFGESAGAQHRLMAGIDVMKDFGASPISELVAGGKTDETLSRLNNLGLFRELTLYYNFQKKIAKTDMEIYAGIFPRSVMEGSWSQAMFSDSLVFYDNNLEGLLLKFRRPRAYFEVGCDWMGQYGTARREKFMIFTAGEGKVLPFMSLGYAGYMLHYANSSQVKGLVDNILINPYARFELGGGIGLQTLSFRLGWLQAMQRDRKFVGVFVFPFGGEFDQEVRNWNVGIRNKMFFGYDMMPYYFNTDEAGLTYGPNLYFGDPFYRMHDVTPGSVTGPVGGAGSEGVVVANRNNGAGFYDRLEVYYEPQLSKYLSLKVSALFHFHGTRYSGCQQMVGLKFTL